MPKAFTRFLLFLSFLFLTASLARAGCVDSIHIKIQPVQCKGLRNGVVEVIEVFGGQAPYYFSIDGQSFSTRPVFDLLWAGEYTIYVRDASGCVQQYQVLVPEPEEFRVKLTVNDSSIVAGEWIQIKAIVYPKGSTVTSIEWRPAALFVFQNQLTQTVRVAEDTRFAVEIRNSNACTAYDELDVPVAQTNLYFPNVFNPRSAEDNYFTLFAGQGVSRIVSLQIFDRGGNLVFEKRNFQPNDPLKGWNGIWGDRMAPSGVYPWVAKVEFLNGNEQHYSGSVTLISE